MPAADAASPIISSSETTKKASDSTAHFECCGLKTNAKEIERSIWDLKMPQDPHAPCRSGTEQLTGYLQEPCVTDSTEVEKEMKNNICQLKTR